MKRFVMTVVLGCVLLGCVGCATPLFNTHMKAGEKSGDGLKYYRTNFPRETGEPYPGARDASEQAPEQEVKEK